MKNKLFMIIVMIVIFSLSGCSSKEINNEGKISTIKISTTSSIVSTTSQMNEKITTLKSITTTSLTTTTLHTSKIKSKDFQRGVTFGGMLWNEENKRLIDENIETLVEFNIKYIALIPEWFVFPNVNGAEIKPYYDEDSFPNPTGWITPTLKDEEIKNIIKKAREKGIKVMLKPHIDPIDFGVKEGSSRGSLDPSDWDEWFGNYKRFVLHYAKLAEEENVELFVIGTELDTAVRNVPLKKWYELIGEVRKIYGGKITYSASCFGECWSPKQVGFWDKLDYIGFEPYFGLTDKNDPSVEDMKKAFDEKIDMYAKPLYEKYDKPIIITEANVYSYDGVNKHPIDPPDNDVADYEEQADYYEAVFESINEREWIKGIYWWGWYLDSTSKGWNIKDDLYDPFVRKPAGEVLKEWYW